MQLAILEERFRNSQSHFIKFIELMYLKRCVIFKYYSGFEHAVSFSECLFSNGFIEVHLYTKLFMLIYKQSITSRKKKQSVKKEVALLR